MDTHATPTDLTRIQLRGPSFEEYCALNAVNWSTLRELRKSPLHYAHRLAHPSEDTTQRGIARAVHTAVLEPERFMSDYAIFTGPRRAGKEWDAFEAAAGVRTILKTGERDEALAIAAAVRSHPEAAKYLAFGQAEHTVQWTDGETGIGCKGRMDWYRPNAIVDLKTLDNVSIGNVGMMVWRHQWNAQLAFYQEGVRVTTRETLPLVIIAVENKPPYDVGVFRLDEFAAGMGLAECKRLLALLKSCRESKAWPGRYADEQPLALPQWVVSADALPVPEINLDGESLT